MGININKSLQQSLLNGLFAGVSLLSSYFLIMRVATGSWDVAIDQYQSLWLLMSLLIIGFGVQVALYTYVKAVSVHTNQSSVAATGATSTGAMIACCAHHIVDILPIVGLTGLSVFLAEYQSIFLLLGIFSNIVGIGYLLRQYLRYKRTHNVPFQRVVTQIS